MLFTPFEKFWEKHPALLYSLAALLGTYLVFFPSFWLIIPGIALFFSAKNRRLLGGIVLLASSFYTQAFQQFPEVPIEGQSGTLWFSPSSITTTQSPFGEQWCYQGKGHTFLTDKGEKIGHNFPCSIRLSKKKALSRPLTNRSYLIEGNIKPTPYGKYILLPNRASPWIPVEKTWSFSEMRFDAKQALKRYISKQYGDPRSAEFLSGIITGEFEDRFMRQEFSRAGLQHIMAISGFHFTIISAALLIFLRVFLYPKRAVCVLIFLLSLYVLFLGPSASILRAWIMSLVALGAVFHEKSSFPLNSLGLGILFLLILDPSYSLSLGYVFSFAVTASILLFYSPAKKSLDYFLPLRNFEKTAQMSFWDQCSFIVVTLFKNAMALCVAVNLVALPLTFFYFQKFPILSLFYNLIVPFLVSVEMIFFLAGLMCPWIHVVNGWLMHFMLNLIYNLPSSLHVLWRWSFATHWIILYVSIVGVVGILVWEKRRERIWGM